VAEQFLVAWAASHEALFAAVGSNDAELAKKALLKRNKAIELDGLFRDYGTDVRSILATFLTGKLDPKQAGQYRRLLELVAPKIGVSAGPEAILPGRGWQDLAPWLAKAKLPKLAAVWKTQASFPWAKAPKQADSLWPRLRFIPQADQAALAKELGTITKKKVAKLPERQAGCEDDLYACLKTFSTWLAKAKAKGTDLVVLHDGQQ